MFEAIESSVRYSDRIVTDLLEYSKDLHLELSETTLKSLVRDALLQAEVPKNITVSDSTSDDHKIQVDAAKICRIFVNLVRNAIDAMPTGGELKISSNMSNSNLEVKFADTGTGIPENVLRELWKPFITTKSKGIGLGLAICKRIVEAHGGSISVNSLAGEGATFTVTLPIVRSGRK
jgi:signal transduction histidine kinase